MGSGGVGDGEKRREVERSVEGGEEVVERGGESYLFEEVDGLCGQGMSGGVCGCVGGWVWG